jgi:hypothetical protein
VSCTQSDKESLNKIVDEYLALARHVVSLLKKRAGPETLLRAVNTRKLPRNGEIQDGVTRVVYQFHGAGCRARFGTVEIDFDLGKDDSVPGFDPWKLADFACLSGGEEKYGLDPQRLKRTIDEMAESGELKRIEELPSPHLLALTRFRESG